MEHFFCDHGKPVDRNEIHRVHQEHPDEHGERKTDDKATITVGEDVLDLSVNELVNDFEKRLRLGRHAAADFSRQQVEKTKRERAENERGDDGIDVDFPEVVGGRKAMHHVGQVMLDVFRRRLYYLTRVCHALLVISLVVLLVVLVASLCA